MRQIYSLFHLEIWFLFLIFSLNESTFHPSQMCKSRENQDCSFQLPHAEQNQCRVYNTSICLSGIFDFPEPALELSSESEAKFSTAVEPYSAAVLELQKDIPLSAINIIFTVLHKSVKGFSVVIRDNAQNITLCRIMDFKDYSKEITIPTSLFYDCFYNMVEYNIQNVQMVFKALPMNEELCYYVYIPPVMTRDSKCVWPILIMVFCGSLSKGIVQVKFSRAPELMNVTSYSVKLVQETSNKVMRTQSTASLTLGDMTYVEFPSVEDGSYYISVEPQNTSTINFNCLPAKIAPFRVTVHSLDKMVVLYICITLILIFSFFFLWKCLQTYVHPELPPKQVLLVYSYDCSEHEAFVSSFSKYLTDMCKINVSTIYNKIEAPDKWKRDKDSEVNTKDPKQFIRDKYKEADAIIFLISKGLYLTLGTDKTIQIKEGKPWRNQVQRTAAYISVQIFNSDSTLRKKFCKVYFSYSDKAQIPHCLSDMGRCYQLPKEFNQFLCFIFDCSPIIPFLNFYPRLRGSHPRSSDVGRAMLERMKTVQKAVDNNTHVTKIQRKRNIEKSNSQNRNICSASSPNVSTSSIKLLNDYEQVKSEDSETCDEELVDRNESDSYLKDWEDYLIQEHSVSKNSDPNNKMTSLVMEEFT